MTDATTNTLRATIELKIKLWQTRLMLLDICIRIGNSNAMVQTRKGNEQGPLGSAYQDLNITAHTATSFIKSLLYDDQA